MTGEQFRQIRMRMFMVAVLLGPLCLVTVESNGQNKPPPPPPPRVMIPVEELIAKPEDKPVQKPSTDPASTAPLKIEMLVFPEVVRVGERHTFVANATGGTKPYKYQWSGNNMKAGTGKANSVSTRNSIPVSFKNLGTSVVTVHVIDENNNIAQTSVTVKVVPRK